MELVYRLLWRLRTLISSDFFFNLINYTLTLMASDRFSIPAEDYLAKHHVLTYMEDAISQLLTFKEDNPKVNPGTFLKEYFSSIRDGSHTAFREYNFVSVTPHNRASFIKIFWKAFSNIGKSGALLNVREYHSLLCLLCPDFPMELVKKTAGIIFMEDAMDSLTSFADFIYAFQIQFYFEEFLQICSEVYTRLMTAPSPREAVYIPSEASPRQEKKPLKTDQPPQDGVEARQFRDALLKECADAEFSCPSNKCLHSILDQTNRVTFYGFLMALAKSETINSDIGTLPSKGELFGLGGSDSEFSSPLSSAR